jgi:hypothetical protein
LTLFVIATGSVCPNPHPTQVVYCPLVTNVPAFGLFGFGRHEERSSCRGAKILGSDARQENWRNDTIANFWANFWAINVFSLAKAIKFQWQLPLGIIVTEHKQT